MKQLDAVVTAAFELGGRCYKHPTSRDQEICIHSNKVVLGDRITQCGVKLGTEVTVVGNLRETDGTYAGEPWAGELYQGNQQNVSYVVSLEHQTVAEVVALVEKQATSNFFFATLLGGSGVACCLMGVGSA